MHCGKNFPFRKSASDLDLDLPVGTADADYLARLREALPTVRLPTLPRCMDVGRRGAGAQEEHRRTGSQLERHCPCTAHALPMHCPCTAYVSPTQVLRRSAAELVKLATTPGICPGPGPGPGPNPDFIPGCDPGV